MKMGPACHKESRLRRRSRALPLSLSVYFTQVDSPVWWLSFFLSVYVTQVGSPTDSSLKLTTEFKYFYCLVN